jgi:indole-3-glycerol phosphate synthase
MMEMKNILEKIFYLKKKEIEERRALYPQKLLERSPYFPTEPVSLKKYVLRKDKNGIIAEFKLRSPSKGYLNYSADVSNVTLGYMQAGASALSILTDYQFFGGSLDNLKKARKENYCPVLQKDFILDTYQLIEAKSYGADAVLLIASMLSKEQLKFLSRFAHSLGLEVLFEIHKKEELNKLNNYVDLVGINNRNLQTFQVDLSHSVQVKEAVPSQFATIAESGINSPETVFYLQQNGFNGFLIGEAFMKQPDPAKACRSFVSSLRKLQQNKQVIS